MASSAINSHPSQYNATSHGSVDVREPAASTELTGDVKNAEKLEFDETDVKELFKKNFRVQICVGILSNMSRPTVCVFDAGAGSNLVCTSYLPVNRFKRICPIQNMSLRPASNNPRRHHRKIILSIQPGDIHVFVDIGAVDNLAVPLLIGTSFIDRFVKEIYPMER